MKRFASLATVVAVLATAAVPASAQTFFGEDVATFGQSNNRLTAWPNATDQYDLFSSYLSEDVGTEDFEGIASGTSNPALTFPGAGTATLNGSGYVERTSSTSVSNSGLYGSSGTAYYRVNTGQNFTVTFSDPTAAFGFFATDVGDYGGQLYLSFLHADASTTSVEVAHSRSSSGQYSGSMLFYGLIDVDNPFQSVTFSGSGGGETFAFDDMTIASTVQIVDPPQSVPEPASLLLLASGLLGLGTAGIRRRRQNGSLPE